MRPALCALLVCSLPGPALGQARPAGGALRAGLLPTRRADAGLLADEVRRLAGRLSPAGSDEAGAAPRFDLRPTIERADTLGQSGRLDEAAALYDVAIDEGTRAPLRVADPAALVHALVARATIGLARGEGERAAGLLGRLYRYDPAFAPLPIEDTPRLRAALDRVREKLGARPALRPDDLGERCDEPLLVGRPLEGGGLELLRFAGCRLVASAAVAVGAGASDEAALAALGGPAIADPPAPAAAPGPAPAPPAAARADRPFWRRAWFWTAVGGVVAGAAAVGIYAGTRADEGIWNVRPHF